MMLSVIGQPVPLLVVPQELNITRLVIINTVNKIIFFILNVLIIGPFAAAKIRIVYITNSQAFYFNLSFRYSPLFLYTSIYKKLNSTPVFFFEPVYGNFKNLYDC